MPFSRVEILRAACCVAGHDGEINDAELTMLQQLARQAGVGAASLNAMMDRARIDPQFYREQFRLVSSSGDDTIKVLFLVAIADHELTEQEVRMLWHFARKLGMAEDRFRQIYAMARKQIKDQAATTDPSTSA